MSRKNSMNPKLTRARNILLGLLGLTLIIVVHEFGHFMACKLFKVKTPVFSIGFPPVLASVKLGQTKFQVGALPLGGYVSIDQQDLSRLPYVKKMIIILAGIAFNILFTILGFAYLSYNKTDQTEEDDSHDNKPNLFKKMFSRKSKSEFIGPIGIIALMEKSVAVGFNAFLYFLSIISLNIAIFNLLPIPFLDGGQALEFTIEALYGKTLPSGFVNIVYILFLVLFLLLSAILSVRDITRIKKD